MGTHQKVLAAILSGRSDANISFSELVGLVKELGFDMRITGDHHIFTRTGVDEIINLQPNGNKAKPYQVKQVRGLILKHHLGVEQDD